MFNLEQEITKWRQQLAAGGIKGREALDELESHLREDVEKQMDSGSKKSWTSFMSYAKVEMTRK